MVEPLTLAAIKQHLDVVRDDQDDMLVGMGVTARQWVEAQTGLGFDGQQVTQPFSCFDRINTLRCWPEGIDGASPVIRIDYADAAGTMHRIDNARLWLASKPARVLPPLGERWPTDCVGPVAVTVTGLPCQLKAAMLLLVGNLYANRESTITGTSVGDTGAVEMLCHPYRLPVIG